MMISLPKIRYRILRAKRNEPDPQITSVDYIVGNGDQESTPTTDRRNQAFEEIADAERGPDNEDEDYEEMNDFQFDSIDDNIPPNYDWSAGYLPSLAKLLVEFKDKFYKDQEELIMSNLVEPLILFDIKKHRPEKCLGNAQIFLVYEHLYYHYLNERHTSGLESVLPPSLFTVIEGKP